MPIRSLSNILRTVVSPGYMNDATTRTSDLIQMVSFVIDREEFGVEILRVQEIIRLVEITRVPHAPVFVEGVINLRGKIVPVIDLRKRFRLSRRDADKDTRIIVVELEDRVVGFMVDSVREVIRVDRTVIEPPPDLAIGIDAHYITGVAKLEDRLLIILDLDEVLTGDEEKALEEVREAA
jgi:purine-binding chemotaxis protein CheW